MTSTIDRISGSIYQNALGQHREEHRQLARWAAMLEFREKVAGFRAEIDAKRAYSLEQSFGKAA